MIKLTTGVDKILSQAGRGCFWNGLTLRAPGIVVPITVQKGKQFPVAVRFIPGAEIKAAAG